MKIVRLLLLVALLYIPDYVNAMQRTQSQKIDAAKSVLFSPSALHRAPALVRQLYADSLTTVIGHDGAFAVIANDMEFPAVLAYSDTPYDGESENPGYRWWKSAVYEVLGSKNYAAADEIIRPGEQHNDMVAPLLSCKWAQDWPYNKYCPRDGEDIALVGCVATAMAQCMYFNESPVKGQGERTIYYPFNDRNGTPYTVDFSRATYDWGNMLDSYRGKTDQIQDDAVALLNYHCGVACNMQYGVNESGAFIKDAADGLIRYFGYPASVTWMRRINYGLAEWMDMVFTELSRGYPIIYGGRDPDNGYGHAFVIDGYDTNGLVHVNWGWDGSYNGYFDISLLNTTQYSFSDDQEMVTGIDGKNRVDLVRSVVLTSPGSLCDLIDAEEKYKVTELTVGGPMNSTDLRFIREMAGRQANDKRTRGRLEKIDLAKASIVAGGEPYLDQLTTSDNQLPPKAFFNCQGLSSVVLPDNLKAIGDGAFAYVLGLDSIKVNPASDADFVIDGGVIYSRDMKHCITVLPFVRGELKIKDGVTSIAEYGAAGCGGIDRIDLPASLEQIGGNAFSDDSYVSEIKVRTKVVPRLTGKLVFDGIVYPNCLLYVPAGYKSLYDNAEQWRMFLGSYYDNILQFGSLIEAKNLSRRYGEENPKFAYSVTGDAIKGVPEIVCEAVATSPANARYTISISAGTVEGSDVEFRDGYLVVTRAPLTVKADDARRPKGSENPSFTFTCEGLKNNETPEEAFSVMPAFECAATADSPEGEYPITVSGAKAANYSIKYEQGVLTVDPLAGVGAIESESAVTVTSQGMTIMVGGVCGKSVSLFGITGVLIEKSPAGQDEASFDVAAKGVYIVKAGNKSFKVIVK